MRLNHVSVSCVSRAIYESACPRDLPLSAIFVALGEWVRRSLDYNTGDSLEDKIPTATLKETGVNDYGSSKSSH